MIKFLLLLLCTSVYGRQRQPICNEQTALINLRRATYDFSVQILDRVAQDRKYENFVFSPISSWLQLIALADGAKDTTLNEILNVTKYHRMVCFRKQVRKIFNSLEEDLAPVGKQRSIIVVDNLYDVKESYKSNIEKLNAAKVLSLNFRESLKSATIVNEIIEMDTNGVIQQGLDAQDFNMSVLLMTDISYMKADWRTPFNPAYTRQEAFYSDDKAEIGQVKMMYQTGYFNATNIPSINAKALELPFNDRATMLFLLTNAGKAADLFLSLQKIRLMTIFSLMKRHGPMLVNVKLPRFKVTTDIDNIPELLYDMGLHRVFYPKLANLTNISDHKVFVSMMMNAADIEVTEEGVTASDVAESLIMHPRATNFYLNRPFAYLIVDRKTEAILYAGIYAKPSLL